MCGLLKALGVRTRRVADLSEGKLYVPDRQLLLFDFELSEVDVIAAMDRLIPAMFQDPKQRQ